MELKDVIKLHRERMNVSRAALGRLIGASRSAVSKWENGELRPGLSKIMKLAECFDVTETELLHPKDETEENEDSKNVQ